MQTHNPRVPGGYRQDPAEVAVLLNDAKAALVSDRAFARRCIARALDLLHEDLAPASGPSTPQGGLAGWQVRRTIAYIEAHLESTIRVKDLAALTRLSASHFSREFKRSFGEAPMTYVTRQRVELAQRLLLTTEDSVCQISLACGMCDQAHLTRVFRRVVGDSPMAWRRRHAVAPGDVSSRVTVRQGVDLHSRVGEPERGCCPENGRDDVFVQVTV